MNEMTLTEHLEELRRRLIASLIAAGAGMVTAFVLRQPLLHILERPHRLAMRSLNLDPTLYVFRYEETFFSQFKLCCMAGVILVSPFIIYQIWKFIGAALIPTEKKLFWHFFPASIVLFLGGALFGYFFLIPFGMTFLAKFGMEAGLFPMIHFSHYVSLFFFMTLVTGIIFELPLFMVFATKVGFISSRIFKKRRRVAILSIFITAAILTPTPDPVNQLLLALPLLLLYEIGCLLCTWTEKRKARLQTSLTIPLISAVVIPCLIGCGTILPMRVTKGPHISISVEQSKDHNRWTVTYRMTPPVDNLVFNRQTSKFRAARWRSLNSNVEIKEIEGKETIVSIDKNKFNTATFEFSPYYEVLAKDYPFFFAFGDKSLAIYTGHFNVCPERERCNRPVRFEFKGREEDNIILFGKSEPLLAAWTDPTGEGTYVYFGQIKTLETKNLTAIIDPSLPSWLDRRFHELLPKLFDFYTARTGYPLTFKPFILLSYSKLPDSGSRGRSNKGGVLPGLIHLSLYGKEWLREDPETFLDVAQFLAHEAAHFWNSKLFKCSDDDTWMHEGGADAFAYFALLQLGLISEREFLGLQTGAYNECMSALKNRPLKDVREDPHLKAHYHCGAMVSLLSHAAIKKHHETDDLFSFWQALFSTMKEEELDRYSEETYFRTLTKLTGEKELAEKLSAFINGPAPSPSHFLRTELERLGVKFEPLETHPPAKQRHKIAADLVRLLMSEDCGNRYSLHTGGAEIETEPVPTCKVFTRRFVIEKIGPHSLKEGHKAYDFVFEQCQGEKREITMKVKGEHELINVACPKNMPKRAPILAIRHIPL